MANIGKRRPQVQKMLEDRAANTNQGANANQSAGQGANNSSNADHLLRQIKPKRISRQKGEK